MGSKGPNPDGMEAKLAELLASSPALRRDDSFYVPRQQIFYGFRNGWIDGANLSSSPARVEAVSKSNIRVITWNIDVLIGGVHIRMVAALDYLKDLVAEAPKEIPLVIFLQEMCDEELKLIQEAPWIRERFFITDTDTRHWEIPEQGTTVLIDNRLAVLRVFRVPWVSKFGRDGLFIDLSLEGSDKVLRLCNTHLESLVAEPPVRPVQMASGASYLHASDVEAGVLAGDLNAIQPFDRTLPTENGLSDAYLELGGVEDSHDGYTWGYQVPEWMQKRFGCSRMDKVLFCGGIRPIALVRIGIGVKVPEDKREELRRLRCEDWVTDHYGLSADMALGNVALRTLF